MGSIGGFFKSVVRIVVPIAVSLTPWGTPLVIAISAAAATGATGGSFKESLMAGATSLIGSAVTKGLQAPMGSVSGVGERIAAGSASVAHAGAQVGTNALGEVIGPAFMTGTATVAGQAGAALSPALTSAAQGLGVVIDNATGQVIAGVIPEGAINAATGKALNYAPGVAADMMTPEALSGAVEASQSMLAMPLDEVPFLGAAKKAVIGPTEFRGTSFGTTASGTNFTPLDYLLEMGDKGLEAVGFDTSPMKGLVSVQDLLASGAGSFTELTLNQALNADLPGIDEVLGQKYSPEQVSSLRNEARNALSQQAYDRLIGETTNPFLQEGQDPIAEQAAIEEFNKIIASGIERENVLLGPDITETQFGQVFDNPDLGQIILGDEERLRREAAGRQIGAAFPGGVFQSLDDDIINSIVQERRGPAEQQIGRFEARGNLNPLGGQTANLFLSGQEPAARERVSEVGGGVLGTARSDIGDIRERAEQAAGGYTLGQDLFDVAPFSEERAGVVEARQGTLGEDVRTALGTEPLFDVSGALQTAGRAQGAVSGTPNQAFLDAIAAREQGALRGNRTRRGLGSRGSGVF